MPKVLQLISSSGLYGAERVLLELASFLCIKILERTSAEGTTPSHELIQVDLLPASRAGGVGCMHS